MTPISAGRRTRTVLRPRSFGLMRSSLGRAAFLSCMLWIRSPPHQVMAAVSSVQRIRYELKSAKKKMLAASRVFHLCFFGVSW